MIKIVLVVPELADTYGGAKRDWLIAQGLRSHPRVELEILAGKGPPDFPFTPFEMPTPKIRGRWVLRCLNLNLSTKLAQLLRDRRADIIQVHSLPETFTTLFSRENAKVIYDAHDCNALLDRSITPFWPGTYLIERLVVRAVDYITTVSSQSTKAQDMLHL